MTPMKIQSPVNLFLGPPFYGNISDKNVDLGRFDKYVDLFFRTLDVVHFLIQEHDDFLTMTPKRKYRDFDPSTIPSDRCLPQINLPRLSLTRLPRCTWIILDYFTTAPNCSNVTLLSQHKYSHIDFDLRFSNCQLLICSLGLFKPLPLNVILRFRIVVVRSSAPVFKKLLFALRCPP